MPAISDNTLIRYMNQGEIECSIERPFLVKRISLAAVIGKQEYVLPDECISIRRVLWLGWKNDPLPMRNYRDVFQGQNYQKGRPFWYVYNNVGLQTIKMFPAPDQTTTVIPIETDCWKPSEILSAFIVEYYCTSDNLNLVLPPWIKRQLLKMYVSKMVYSNEGPLQSLKLAQYFAQKWELKKKEFFVLLDALYGEPRKLVTNQIVSNNYFPGSPVLPITRFGISVEPGYD
jgi:hypothetical protein